MHLHVKQNYSFDIYERSFCIRLGFEKFEPSILINLWIFFQSSFYLDANYSTLQQIRSFGCGFFVTTRKFFNPSIQSILAVSGQIRSKYTIYSDIYRLII
ncbi:F-box only protein 33-like [Sarcoptes scabiei]|nr:F-box only protein 33-like [Sarcoptes scabiei]